MAFKGALYVGAGPMVWSFPYDQYQGGQIYRSFDGIHWQMVVGHGFGDTLFKNGVDILLLYHDQLIALSNDQDPSGGPYAVTYVWSSRTGNPND